MDPLQNKLLFAAKAENLYPIYKCLRKESGTSIVFDLKL